MGDTILGDFMVSTFPLLLIIFLPSLILIMSKQTSGREKAIWVILSLFASWLTLLAYYIFAPLKRKL